MRCPKCYAEIPVGASYCNNCGAKVDLSADLDMLEDDYLMSVLEKDRSGNKTQRYEEELFNKEPEIRESPAEKKKRRNMVIITALVAAISVVSILTALVLVRRTTDPDYLYAKAAEAYTNRNYQSAAEYAQKVLDIDPDNADASFIYAACMYGLGEYDEAKTNLYEICTAENDNYDAFKMLLEIYERESDYTSISALRDITDSTNILALINTYMLPTPRVDTDSGDYSEFISVVITSTVSNSRIFYTLDGTDPTDASTLYNAPISIDTEGKTTLKTILMDADGNSSDIVERTYNIKLEVPSQPSVDPTTGTFTSVKYVTVTADAGCTVYYTWDGTDPTTDSDVCTGSIKIPEGNNVLSLIAVSDSGRSSEVLKCSYAYYPEREADETGTDENAQQDGSAEGGEGTNADGQTGAADSEDGGMTTETLEGGTSADEGA